MLTNSELVNLLQAEDPGALVMVNPLPTDYRDGGVWNGDRWTFAVERLQRSEGRVYIDCQPPGDEGIESMDIKQPDDDTVVNAIHETLHRLYGEPITALLMWQPPGATTMNLASNAERQAMIKSLRQAADNMELGPLPHRSS